MTKISRASRVSPSGDQGQLLPADQAHQPVPPEEEREAPDAERARHSESGRAQLHDDAEHPQRHQERAHHRMREEPHHVLGPGRVEPSDLGAGEAEPGQHGVEVVGPDVDDLELQGLVGRQRQELALGDHAGDHHVGVDHGLGHERRPLPRPRRSRGTPCACRRRSSPLPAGPRRPGRPSGPGWRRRWSRPRPWRSARGEAIRAPAEIARLLTKATVLTRARSKSSRMSTAASTRPPKVLMSRITAAAPAPVASSRTRRTKGATPRSMMPSTGAT